MTIRLILLIALFAGTLAPAVANDDEVAWHEIRTDNFIIRTDVERERAVALATDLEKYRFTVGYLSGIDTRDVASVPVTVYAFGETDNYHRTTGAYGTLGVYMARASGPLAMLTLEDPEEKWQSTGRQVLFHEYSHHVLHQFSPLDYPRWYDEGFAEYLSTMEFDGDHAVIGHATLGWAPLLKRTADWVKAFEIIDSRGRYMGHIGTNVMRDPRRGKGGMRMQYAQGWLMVHYLHSNPRLQEGIARYLTAINRSGVSDEQAFKQAFGIDYKRFDRALKRYWRDAKFAIGRVEIASKLPTIEPEVRTMPAEEIEIVPHELYIHTGRGGSVDVRSASRAFRACIDAGIRPLDMRQSLFLLALGNEKWDDAAQHLGELNTHHADTAEALTAGILLERMRSDDELEPELAGELRATATRAILANPTYVPALIQYADLTFDHDLDVDDNTRSVIDSIRYLAPDLQQGRIFEARWLAAVGAPDQAEEVIDDMIKWSSSPEQANRLRRLKKELGE